MLQHSAHRACGSAPSPRQDDAERRKDEIERRRARMRAEATALNRQPMSHAIAVRQIGDDVTGLPQIFDHRRAPMRSARGALGGTSFLARDAAEGVAARLRR